MEVGDEVEGWGIIWLGKGKVNHYRVKTRFSILSIFYYATTLNIRSIRV